MCLLLGQAVRPTQHTPSCAAYTRKRTPCIQPSSPLHQPPILGCLCPSCSLAREAKHEAAKQLKRSAQRPSAPPSELGDDSGDDAHGLLLPTAGHDAGKESGGRAGLAGGWQEAGREAGRRLAGLAGGWQEEAKQLLANNGSSSSGRGDSSGRDAAAEGSLKLTSNALALLDALHPPSRARMPPSGVRHAAMEHAGAPQGAAHEEGQHSAGREDVTCSSSSVYESSSDTESWENEALVRAWRVCVRAGGRALVRAPRHVLLVHHLTWPCPRRRSLRSGARSCSSWGVR